MKKPGRETGEILKLLSVALTYHGDRLPDGRADYQARLFSRWEVDTLWLGTRRGRRSLANFKLIGN